jgi:hypothetical protein
VATKLSKMKPNNPVEETNPLSIRLKRASTTSHSTQVNRSLLPLQLQRVDLLVQHPDILDRLRNGRVSIALVLPALDPFLFLGSASEFCLDLTASRTLDVCALRIHDEFHAAGFAGAVFFVAMLLEAAPLEVAASENDLLVEAHVVASRIFRLGGLILCGLWLRGGSKRRES